MQFSIRIDETKKGCITVILAGAIDSQTTEAFEKTVKPLLDKDFFSLVFDFFGVTYITSSGLGIMVEVEKSVRARKKHLFVINLPPQIQKVLSVIAALPSLKIFKNVEELEKYLIYLQRGQNTKDSL